MATNRCATSWANNICGAHSWGGNVFATPRICSRGSLHSELYLGMDLGTEPAGYEFEQSMGHTSEIAFLADRVLIPNINTTMEVLGEDLFSSFEIIVWLPEDSQTDYDTVVTQSKTIWRGKITLIDGQVLVEGDFPATGYSLTSGADGQAVLNIIGWDLEVLYPAGIGSETMIEVLTISDGGSSEETILAEALESTSNNPNVDITLYPVPTDDMLTICYNNEFAGNTVVSIYNAAGEQLEVVFEGNLEIGNHTFYQPFANLGLASNEMYYVHVSVDEYDYIVSGLKE